MHTIETLFVFFCFGVLFNERSYLLNISDGMVDMKIF